MCHSACRGAREGQTAGVFSLSLRSVSLSSLGKQSVSSFVSFGLLAKTAEGGREQRENHGENQRERNKS